MVSSDKHIRRYERIPASGEFPFSLSRIELGQRKEVNSKAEILNTSEGGLCIKTPIPLEVGNILNFEFSGQKRQAMVKWVLREEGFYIAGIMFINSRART